MSDKIEYFMWYQGYCAGNEKKILHIKKNEYSHTVRVYKNNEARDLYKSLKEGCKINYITKETFECELNKVIKNLGTNISDANNKTIYNPKFAPTKNIQVGRFIWVIDKCNNNVEGEFVLLENLKVTFKKYFVIAEHKHTILVDDCKLVMSSYDIEDLNGNKIYNIPDIGLYRECELGKFASLENLLKSEFSVPLNLTSIIRETNEKT